MGEKKEKDNEKKDKKDKKDKKKKGKVKKIVVVKKKLKGKMGKFGQKAAQKKKEEKAAPKVLLKTEDDYEPVNRWWEREDGALSGKRGAKKWDTFEHHGLMFAPEYEPHGIGVKYDGV